MYLWITAKVTLLNAVCVSFYCCSRLCRLWCTTLWHLLGLWRFWKFYLKFVITRLPTALTNLFSIPESLHTSLKCFKFDLLKSKFGFFCGNSHFNFTILTLCDRSFQASFSLLAKFTAPIEKEKSKQKVCLHSILKIKIIITKIF